MDLLNNAVIGLIVGALVAFIPTERSRRAADDEAHRVRIEERRADAYAAFLEDLNQAYYLAERFAVTAIAEEVAPGTDLSEPMGTEDLVPTREDVLTFYQDELVPSSVRVELVGSAELSSEAYRLGTAFLGTINDISDPALRDFQSRVGSFTEDARRELG
jgi:hypothetical protein